MKKNAIPFVCVISFLSGSGIVRAGGPRIPTYWQDVRPVLRKNCTFCHAQRHIRKLDVSGGVALDDYAAIRLSIKKKIIVPGSSAKSRLVQRLLTKDIERRMPLDDDPLPDKDVGLFRRWIDSGAKEGKRPDDIPITKIARKSRRRKRNIALLTKAIPPRGLLGKTAPAALQLNLKAGPLAPVTAVAFSPKGTLLVAGSYGQVVVWDLSTAKPVQILTSVLGAVNDLEFSPDGTVLAVAGGQPSARGDLRLYRVSDWKLLAAFRDHSDVVYSIAFHPGGKRLASASFDTTVRIWNVEKSKHEKTFSGHSDFVYAAAWSNDGKILASVSKDRSVRLTDAATGKSLFTLGGMNEDIMAVAFSGDGKYVISSGFETSLYWWDTKTGEKEKTQRGHGTAVYEIERSKDGSWLVSAGADRTVRIWNGQSGGLLRTISVGSPVYAAAVSPDKKWIASGSFDGFVKLWQASSGQHLLTLLALSTDDDDAKWLALTPEGHLSANAGLEKLACWTMRGAAVDSAPVWQSLRRPQMVVGKTNGKKIPNPSFSVTK